MASTNGIAAKFLDQIVERIQELEYRLPEVAAERTKVEKPKPVTLRLRSLVDSTSSFFRKASNSLSKKGDVFTEDDVSLAGFSIRTAKQGTSAEDDGIEIDLMSDDDPKEDHAVEVPDNHQGLLTRFVDSVRNKFGNSSFRVEVEDTQDGLADDVPGTSGGAAEDVTPDANMESLLDRLRLALSHSNNDSIETNQPNLVRSVLEDSDVFTVPKMGTMKKEESTPFLDHVEPRSGGLFQRFYQNVRTTIAKHRVPKATAQFFIDSDESS